MTSGRGRRREGGLRGVGKDGDEDASWVESRLRFMIERVVSGCDVTAFPRPWRRLEERCWSWSNASGTGVLGGSFLILRVVEALSARLSEANEVNDCDLLSEPIIEEALLSPRFWRPGRPIRPEGGFSDFTWVDADDFKPRRPNLSTWRFEAGVVAAGSSATGIDGEPGSLRGLTSRSGRTGLAGRGFRAEPAFGVHGVWDPDILGTPRCPIRSWTGVVVAEAD